MTAEPFSFHREVARALSLPWVDRRPDARTLRGYHRVDDPLCHGVWLLPSALRGMVALPRCLSPLLSRDLARLAHAPSPQMLYWYAHALRQRAWRALHAVPGPGPIVHCEWHVQGQTEGQRLGRALGSVTVRIAMTGLPGRPVPRTASQHLERAFTDEVLARDRAWAARKTADQSI